MHPKVGKYRHPPQSIDMIPGLGYELVSTGGSANAIEGAGVPVTRVEELTGFPEMLDGESYHLSYVQLFLKGTRSSNTTNPGE